MRDPGFEVQLLGGFDVGEGYWSAMAQTADCILEIESNVSEGRRSPIPDHSNERLQTESSECGTTSHVWRNPRVEAPAFAHGTEFSFAKVLKALRKIRRAWAFDNAGVRVFMEGFRACRTARQETLVGD